MGWKIYDELIAGIPEDVQVIDYGLGLNWSWLNAECGCGMSYTTRGGMINGGKRDLRGKSLRKAAELAKSWNFEDATIGIAALNAWYSQKAQIDVLSGSDTEYAAGKPLYVGGAPQFSTVYGSGKHGRDDVDPFDMLRPEIEGKGGEAKVVVVGHFPHVEDITEYASLTVLERNCKNTADVPDPACEYVVPEADYIFLTGVTIINKTAPRLLELAKDAKTVMVGPSVIPSQTLFDAGADILAGRVVLDPEKLQFCCATREAFGDAIQSFVTVKA